MGGFSKKKVGGLVWAPGKKNVPTSGASNLVYAVVLEGNFVWYSGAAMSTFLGEHPRPGRLGIPRPDWLHGVVQLPFLGGMW